MCWIIANSLGLVSFFKLASQSRCDAVPARRRLSVIWETSYISAARRLLGNWLYLITKIASNTFPLLDID